MDDQQNIFVPHLLNGFGTTLL